MPKKYSTHKKEAGGVAETPPALMEMDGLTAPRLAFLFHAGLWLPAPHEKPPAHGRESFSSALAQQKSTIQAGPCKLQSVSRFGFGDGKTKAQSSVYLTYPVSAGITVTNSPGFSPDSLLITTHSSCLRRQKVAANQLRVQRYYKKMNKKITLSAFLFQQG